MKTKLLSLPLQIGFAFALFFATAVHAQVTTFPWTETFEDSSPTRASWTQIYEVNTMSWTFATTPSTGGSSVTAYEGVKFANYPGTSHNFDKTKLVSPVLDLSGVTNPTVSFYYRNPFWDPDQNWLRIFYRVSASSPWIQIIEYHSDVTAWTSTGQVALPSPSATYQIAVECETDYGYSTTVDALTVTGSLLGVDDVTKSQQSSITYYPNPAENVLNYRSSEKVHEITIYSSTGQRIQTYKTEKNEGKIDVSALSKGAYIIRGRTDTALESFKMIKK